ncbi:phosphoribosylpyrophosphate synthetase [Mucilaginibacter rubeus]|uniref:Phosphoribosylpyrophosphate synthetase n=1 Tax=Mucilaginibacter rubeus TaxID=2027860 RepID=A0AAE6MHP3_9SPHI|nr:MULTISPECIES: phosphoribosylpyrophosphate synthetase [Mucilaginibacter]QEM03738.1 phosphoribosylpyrophosphate synthetase [Mucilaginibacter rubeus]QEM16349.1 phosphoribosylpyrophosphate synthetase [Mucilaginibacter gossypii]QTE40884.1 phosphoribosylpyrophosphate synthetase [Mucilaginibacter rubeus]QTE47487.1 phosphoribosylpyrophosphate synthetase [Mucilaginibacter rubeus]QTE61662.1 phosphoribosylpyrophosphate synthetase [Mucilaginibacter rubeus]
MNNYSNKEEAIIDLQKKGYEFDYVLKSENLLCVQNRELLNPDDFEIVETHLFEREAVNDRGCVIYAIASMHNGLKGILMIAFNTFTNGLSIHLWSKLSAALICKPT